MTGPGTMLRSGRGFTLVEVLLAVTLMSILLGLAYGGLRAATRATDRGQTLLEDAGRVRSTHQFLRRQLNQMLPLAYAVQEESADTERIVFEGADRRIQFVGPMPGYLGSGGPQVQVVELVPGVEGEDLVFRHALLQEFQQDYLYEREPVVLLEGIRSGGFEFLAADEEGQILGWTSAWQDTSTLPVAVSLDLEFDEETRRLWPMFATGVKVDETALTAGGGGSGYQEAIREMIRNPGRESDP